MLGYQVLLGHYWPPQRGQVHNNPWASNIYYDRKGRAVRSEETPIYPDDRMDDVDLTRFPAHRVLPALADIMYWYNWPGTYYTSHPRLTLLPEMVGGINVAYSDAHVSWHDKMDLKIWHFASPACRDYVAWE